MSYLGLSKESIKGLGVGAYLVNVLPSAVLVLGLLALVTSRLYPGVDPMTDEHGHDVAPGLPSVITTLRAGGAAGFVIVMLAILVTTVLLRPFQISAVQWLEGYWRLRAITALGVERHARRRSIHQALSLEMPERSLLRLDFSSIVVRARERYRAQHRIDSATTVVSQYPERADDIMPTLLGNVLRRAETTAGERYGLDTVTTFPRLYPYLSRRLDQENQVQLNIVDTASTLAIMWGTLAAASAPLFGRLDVWGLVPVALTATAGLSYRGARLAAARHATLLATAFDLHRFDMVAGMHRRLPTNADQEYSDNQDLSQVLNATQPVPELDLVTWDYAHPTPGPCEVGHSERQASTTPQQSGRSTRMVHERGLDDEAAG